MCRRLIALMIVIYLLAGLAQTMEGGENLQEMIVQGKRDSLGPPSWALYKSKEEIAYHLLIYAVENIPGMKFRITHYEDLLEAYRQALMVVKEPKEPVVPPFGKERSD